jgi:hypothetical protein
MITVNEIAWTAGIFEGEGTVVARPRYKGIQVQVTQVDKWLPLKLQKLFGGTLWERKSKNEKHRNCWFWSIYGSRAVGFLLTIYTFLSPRRRATIQYAITTWIPACMHREKRLRNGTFSGRNV